jgi:hypothetical protein
MRTPVCIFCALAARAIHKGLGEPGGLPAIAALVAWYLLPSAIALWVRADASARGRQLPYDFDSLVFFAWPLVTPFYLFSTRGSGALCVIGSFLLLLFAAVLFGIILTFPYSFLG